MQTKFKLVLLTIIILGLMTAFAQQKVDVSRISASATGTATAANSDSIVCATDTRCVVTGSGTAGSAASGVVTVQGVASMTPVLTQPNAVATGGTSGCAILATASTNATNCASAAAALYGYELYNTATTVYYLRLYNLASSPTCSSATGFVRSIPIPPASSAGLVGGAVLTKAIANTGSFGTGIGYCITGGSSSTDNTNAATGVFGTLEYKQ